MTATMKARPRRVDAVDPGPRRRRRIRLAIFAGVALIVIAAVWLVWFSPVLEVREVRVVGMEGARAQEVLAAAAVPTGVPLARIDTAAAERAVRELPWVAAAEVRRGWPSEVVLAVQTRVAMAVLAEGAAAPGQATGPAAGATLAIDGSGAVFESSDPLPRKLPRVRAQGPALAAAMEVVTGLPDDLLNRVVIVAATTRDDIDLTLRSGDVVRWGSAQDGEAKAEVLRVLLRRKADMYDVSAPELPTTFKFS